MNTSQTLLGPGCFVLTAAIALPRNGRLDSSKGLMEGGEGVEESSRCEVTCFLLVQMPA